MSEVVTNRPWYRQFWPLFLFALPMSVVIAGIVTAYLAFNGADDVVVDDYYKQGRAINHTLVRDRKAAALGLRAELGYDGQRLSIALTGAAPAALKLHLEHPTRADLDQSLMLTRSGDDRYVVSTEQPLTGAWYLTLSPVPVSPEADWRLTSRWQTSQTALTLSPKTGR